MPNTFTPSVPADAPRKSPPLYNPQTNQHIAAPRSEQAYPSPQMASYAASPHEMRRLQGKRMEQVSKALGWFSIGLGMAQLLAPRAVSRTAGVQAHSLLLRSVGIREIASGVGILSQPKAPSWLWSRVAGDVMDLALLGLAANADKPGVRRKRVAAAAAAVAGIAVMDLWSSLRQTQQARQSGLSFTPSTPGEVDVEKSISINRSPEECYRFWRDFQNFPRFMKHLDEVTVTSETQSHWRAKAPAGTHVTWDAEITVDQPDSLLAWHSLPGADVENAGTVRFAPGPGGRGTVVHVQMHYKPPGGKAGAMIAKLFGEEPATQIAQDLRRFKQLIETGEIPTTIGQPSGPRSMLSRLLFRQGEPG